MIFLISGRPKSGKTYEAVKYHIIAAIKSGRRVITNVPLNVDHFANVFGQEARELIRLIEFRYNNFDGGSVEFYFSKPEHYQDDWRNDQGQGPLYVVDECHFPIPKGRTPDNLKKFFTMHGHYGIDILLMSQQPGQIDKDVLNLVEIMYRTIKGTAFGSQKKYIKKVVDGYRGSVVNEEIRTYDQSIFPFYKAHTQSAKAVIEASARDVKPLWKHWSFKGAALCFVAFIVLIATMDVNILKSNSPEKVVEQKIDEPVKPKFAGGKLSEPAEVINEAAATVHPDLAPSQSEPESDPKRTAKYPFPEHPYYKVRLHIHGMSEFGPADRVVRIVQFSASQNGQYVFDVSSKDLILAGYEVVTINPCLVYVSFREWNDYLTCDVPTVAVGGSLASAE